MRSGSVKELSWGLLGRWSEGCQGGAVMNRMSAKASCGEFRKWGASADGRQVEHKVASRRELEHGGNQTWKDSSVSEKQENGSQGEFDKENVGTDRGSLKKKNSSEDLSHKASTFRQRGSSCQSQIYSSTDELNEFHLVGRLCLRLRLTTSQSPTEIPTGISVGDFQNQGKNRTQTNKQRQPHIFYE